MGSGLWSQEERQLPNRLLLCGDCLAALDPNFPSIGIDPLSEESVDLIYLDPPFNSKQHYNLPFQTLIKAGKADATAVSAFSDTWSWDEETHFLKEWSDKHYSIESTWRAVCNFLNSLPAVLGRQKHPMTAYLLHMAVRLMAMKKVIKSTGSIYLHCDPTASHYLKILMDAIFGASNFRNEIIWSYQRWTGATKTFQRMHDVILFYAASKDAYFKVLKEEYSEKSKHKGRRHSEVVNKKKGGGRN